jgi:hypothetical protein
VYARVRESFLHGAVRTGHAILCHFRVGRDTWNRSDDGSRGSTVLSSGLPHDRPAEQIGYTRDIRPNNEEQLL